MVTIYNTTLSATSQRHFSDGLGGEKKPVYVHRKSSAPTKKLGTNPGAYLCDGADDLCRIGLQTL